MDSIFFPPFLFIQCILCVWICGCYFFSVFSCQWLSKARFIEANVDFNAQLSPLCATCGSCSLVSLKKKKKKSFRPFRSFFRFAIIYFFSMRLFWMDKRNEQINGRCTPFVFETESFPTHRWLLFLVECFLYFFFLLLFGYSIIRKSRG